MSKAVKKLITDELTARFGGVDSGVLIDFRGLDAGNMHELRRTLRAKGARLTVVKNSLARKALHDVGLPDKIDGMLEGAVGICYGGEEPADLAKTLTEWRKKNKDLIRIRGGFLDRGLLTEKDVEDLAKLPSRPQMLGLLVGTLNAPIGGFVNVLAATLRSFCSVINAIKDKKAT